MATYIGASSISVTGIGAGKVTNVAMTMPVVSGSLAVPNMQGIMTAGGGLQCAGPLRTLQMRQFRLSHSRTLATLSAVIAGRRIVLAQMVAPKVHMSARNGTMTGALRLSAAWADRINQILGKHLFHAGAVIGDLTAVVTVA